MLLPLSARARGRVLKLLFVSLSNPGVSGVVIGIAELDHLVQAIGAAERGSLSGATLERLLKIAANDFVVLGAMIKVAVIGAGDRSGNNTAQHSDGVRRVGFRTEFGRRVRPTARQSSALC